MSEIQIQIEALHAQFQPDVTGKIASYIPELAKADPQWFGSAIVTTEGEIYQVGEAKRLFTLQSVSKPFTYGLALADNGRDAVLKRVGVEPVGKSFNAITLDEDSGRPPNPMMNSGAIVVSELIAGEDLTERLNRMLAMFKRYAGRDLHLDGPVFTSERLTGHRNLAIAHLLKSAGALRGSLDAALDFYFQQCSLLVSAVDLATMAATLANRGTNPITGEEAIAAVHVRDILSVLSTCGMYDSSGEWAYRVGIPAKSGVSGGIIGVVPGRMGIAVFSPPLNEQGHSVRGLQVFEALSQSLCLHTFDGC